MLFFREKTDSILCTEFTLCEKMTELVKTSSILLEMDSKNIEGPIKETQIFGVINGDFAEREIFG